MGCFSLLADATAQGTTQLAFITPTSQTTWPYNQFFSPNLYTILGSGPTTSSSQGYASVADCFSTCASMGFPFADVVPGTGGSTAYSTYDYRQASPLYKFLLIFLLIANAEEKSQEVPK